jgi:two-component system chemotaxis response regulator CheY
LTKIKAYNVVIIDDSEIDLELLELIILDLPNVNVLKFRNSPDAMDFLSSNLEVNINLVLCDYLMPTYNGLDILIKFRKKNISAPFIFISTYNSVELTKLCKSEGATGFIVKPYVTHLLLTKIIKAMNYQHCLQA